MQHEDNEQMALGLQLYMAEVIKSLVRSERNQQVMCECGFVGHLLSVGSAALQNENHPLHCPLQYMLERLAAQALEPADLRQFLRLGTLTIAENSITSVLEVRQSESYHYH